MAVRKGRLIPATLCTFTLGIGCALGQGGEQERAACRRDVRQLQAHIVAIAFVISAIRSGEGHLNEHDADSRFSRGNGPLPKSHPNLGRSQPPSWRACKMVAGADRCRTHRGRGAWFPSAPDRRYLDAASWTCSTRSRHTNDASANSSSLAFYQSED